MIFNSTLYSTGGGGGDSGGLGLTATQTGDYTTISGFTAGTSIWTLATAINYNDRAAAVRIQQTPSGFTITQNSSVIPFTITASTATSFTGYWCYSDGSSWYNGCVTTIGNETGAQSFINFAYWYCLAAGTRITLADGSTKPIEAITYWDELQVWNFDEGHMDTAYPLTIAAPEQTDRYSIAAFDNGARLKQVGLHRIYSMEQQRFVYPTQAIGDRCFTESGVAHLNNFYQVEEPVTYYNVITYRHFNLFANGLLTSNRLNNLYPIDERMRFIKDNRWDNSAIDLSEFYIDGFRIRELPPDLYQDGEAHGETNLEYIQGHINRSI